MTERPENPIIVALDGMTLNGTVEMAEKLRDVVGAFKVNDALDHSIGPSIISRLGEIGNVMADTKFHDIPNTVANRVHNLIFGAEPHPLFITVQASGGIAMMSKALESIDAMVSSTKILAVTVLTSLNEEDCNLTFGAPVKAKVLQFARWAMLAGVQGIVCSPKELEFLSKYPELEDLIRVVPGIRPKWAVKPDDQKRVTTPADAISMGADYLVIGRPITKADDPVEAAKRILEEIQAVPASAV